jgi:hypothetical protein
VESFRSGGRHAQVVQQEVSAYNGEGGKPERHKGACDPQSHGGPPSKDQLSPESIGLIRHTVHETVRRSALKYFCCPPMASHAATKNQDSARPVSSSTERLHYPTVSAKRVFRAKFHVTGFHGQDCGAKRLLRVEDVARPSLDLVQRSG